ncbi:MAG: sulfotransferase, partial [Rhodobacteraceae bacterium]|nr:sulfotransferase [Paracoccaceae bacterium]
HQLLIQNLPVAYVTNLASLMPHSAAAGAAPLTASIANASVRLQSYYGRTRALSGPSDGLEFWDRWFGPDRRAVPTQIPPEAAAAMRFFFGRLEQKTGRPVVAKNNNLMASAHLVAEVLPTARFVCLRRDPVYLGQSLLKARKDIHGTSDISYGIDDLASAPNMPVDAVEDVCRQVRFYDELQQRQAARLGRDRFIVIGYEDLCRDPAAVVKRLGHDILGLTSDVRPIAPLSASRTRNLDNDEFRRLAERIGSQGDARTALPPGR